MATESLHLSWLTPALGSLVLAALSLWRPKQPAPGAVTYRYPQVLSVVMMLGATVIMSSMLWPEAEFDRAGIIGIESFGAVFFLMGLGLDRFRILVTDDRIVQGYWPLKNVISFGDVVEVETCDRTKDSYLLVTTRAGKQYKFEQ